MYSSKQDVINESLKIKEINPSSGTKKGHFSQGCHAEKRPNLSVRG
jgi:hypothetical protein